LCFPYKNIGLKVFFAKKPEFELVSPNSLKCPWCKALQPVGWVV